MGDRGAPARISITVRQLVVPEGGRAPALSDAIAAALGRKLHAQAPPPEIGSGLAETIAHSIAGHPQLAALSTGRKRA